VKFGVITQSDSLNLYGRWNFEFPKSKMADGSHCDKSNNHHICATVWPIATNFSWRRTLVLWIVPTV